VARDLVCLSHLRWDFVYQRPNHLMARAARDRKVLFVEEPLTEPNAEPHWRLATHEHVRVATPVLPELPTAEAEAALACLLVRLLGDERISAPVAWFYTPMALPWSRALVAEAAAVVFDSMDFLAGFRGAPPRLQALEAELLATADIVFTGGASLHERLRSRHHDVHCVPSSVDVAHFATARATLADPADQVAIPRPRLGYAGVIDERLDLELIAGVARARPSVQVVLVGPVAKIQPSDLPNLPNVHRLGLKPYAELPAYLGGWDAGWMPFARNDATRFISPTKTPEYLAAGLPVISTSIHDVVDPYGRLGYVSIADDVAGTMAALDAVLAGERPARDQVDAFLAARSWDRTWAAMDVLVERAVRNRRRAAHDAGSWTVSDAVSTADRVVRPKRAPAATRRRSPVAEAG
jgi:UDP-galactopyranose mutase